MRCRHPVPMYFNSLCSKCGINSIDCSSIYEHLQTLLHGVMSNRPCLSPQHVHTYSNLCSLFPCDSEFYAVTVEFESSPVLLLKLESWLFKHFVPIVVYLQPIAGEWDQTYIAIWQVSSFLLKCQQLWSRVTTWMERRWITHLVAGLEFFSKSCHLSTNKGDIVWQSRDAKLVLVYWLCLQILLWPIARSERGL